MCYSSCWAAGPSLRDFTRKLADCPDPKAPPKAFKRLGGAAGEGAGTKTRFIWDGISTPQAGRLLPLGLTPLVLWQAVRSMVCC